MLHPIIIFQMAATPGPDPTVDTKQRQALKGLERSPRSPGLLPRFRAIHQVTAANSYGKILWQKQKKKQVLDES